METSLNQEGLSFGSTELMVVLTLSLIALLIIVVIYYRCKLSKAHKVIIRLMREKASLDQVGHKMLPMLAMSLLLAACSNTDNLPADGDTNRTALSVNAAISAITPSTHRAAELPSAGSTTRAENAQWQSSDAIGIIMLGAGTNTPSDAQTNHRYYTTDGTGTFVPDGGENIAYFPAGGVLVDLIAYYPHIADLATTGTDAFTLPIDVTDQTDLAAIDLMTAPRTTGHSSAQPDVDLAFSHRLSKFVLHVATDETTADIDLAGATAAITGMPATARWDIMAEALEPSITQEVPTISLPMTADGTGSTAILIPAAAADGRTIVITTADGINKFTATFASNLAFQAGTVNTYTITLSRVNTTLNNVSIVDWTEGTAIKDDATLADVITSNGNIELPASVPGTFYLSTTEGTDVLTTYTGIYAWSGTNLTGTTPLTWNQLLSANHTFRATFNPTDAEGVVPAAPGHEKDYLTATATNVAFGSLLNFADGNAMTHANARLILTLTCTDGTLTDTQLATATATVNVTRASTFNAATGAISFSAVDKEVELITATEELAVHTAILAPQTLTGIALLIDGKKYTISKEVELTAGAHTLVTANIVGSEVAISVSIADWATGSTIPGGDIEIDPQP